MDGRDLRLWLAEAKKILVRREAESINAGRYAQAEMDDYQDKMIQLEWSLQLLDSEGESHE
jgi:hypothetical protein